MNNMDVTELTNQIYDTLLQNVGMSPNHVAFELDKVTDQLCYAKDGKIYLEFSNNDKFEISIKNMSYAPNLLKD